MKKWIIGILGGSILVAYAVEEIRKQRESIRKYKRDMKKRHEEFEQLIKEQEEFLKETDEYIKELDEERIRIEMEMKESDERFEKLRKAMNEEYYDRINDNFIKCDACNSNEERLDILRENGKILNDAMHRLKKEGIIKKPWNGSFDEFDKFMSDPNNQLDFS